MIKDLIKEEKSLGDEIYIPKKGHININWKIEYNDIHYQRVLLYIGLCDDDQYRLLAHNNSNSKVRIVKGSKSKTREEVVEKVMKLITERKQIIPQWIPAGSPTHSPGAYVKP